MKYVGLDIHKETVHGTVMDEHGRVLRAGEFINTQDGFQEFFRGIDDAEVALEACYGQQPPYELLERMDYRVKLAHPYDTKSVAKKKIKTDVRDSEKLAHLLRMNSLPEAYAPPKHVRELRDLLYRRTYLVRMQTKLKNRSCASFKAEVVDVSSANPVGKVQRACWNAVLAPEEGGKGRPDGHAVVREYPLSTYQVADLLELFGVKISASSVGRWPQRFGQSAEKIAKRYRVKFSRIWHVDEKFVPHKRERGLLAMTKPEGERSKIYTLTEEGKRAADREIDEFIRAQRYLPESIRK